MARPPRCFARPLTDDRSTSAPLGRPELPSRSRRLATASQPHANPAPRSALQVDHSNGQAQARLLLGMDAISVMAKCDTSGRCCCRRAHRSWSNLRRAAGGGRCGDGADSARGVVDHRRFVNCNDGDPPHLDFDDHHHCTTSGASYDDGDSDRLDDDARDVAAPYGIRCNSGGMGCGTPASTWTFHTRLSLRTPA